MDEYISVFTRSMLLRRRVKEELNTYQAPFCYAFAISHNHDVRTICLYFFWLIIELEIDV